MDNLTSRTTTVYSLSAFHVSNQVQGSARSSQSRLILNAEPKGIQPFSVIHVVLCDPTSARGREDRALRGLRGEGQQKQLMDRKGNRADGDGLRKEEERMELLKGEEEGEIMD